jgi:D-alanine transaminase
MSDTVFLNGSYMPADQATVSVFDRGFLFGDGVYEVIPFYQGRAFGWEGHMVRLERSLSAIQLNNPLSESQWRDVAKHLLKANGESQLVYLQITRGATTPRKHSYEAGTQPTVFANSLSFTPVNTQGVHAITLPDDRWAHCHIKSLNLLPNVLATQAAKQRGAVEAILIRQGLVTEGASSNVFVVKNNQVMTSRLDGSILSGITRSLVMDILASLQHTVKDVDVSFETLMHADEVWLTSVGKEITPVIQIDGQPIGTGKPGPVWERAFAAYQQRIAHDATPL